VGLFERDDGGGNLRWFFLLSFVAALVICALLSPGSKMYGQRRSIRELSEQERQRYCRWWKKYVTLKRVAQMGMLVCLSCGVFSFSGHKLSHLAGLVFYYAFWVTLICGIWWTFLECPRCGRNSVDGGGQNLMSGARPNVRSVG